jgi:predicted PurR-regulated permease PerM
LLFVLVRLIDDFILVPFVVGNSVQLHPLLMLFSVLVGVEWFGFFGLVFAIPATVVIKILVTLFLKSQRDSMIYRHQVTHT